MKKQNAKRKQEDSCLKYRAEDLKCTNESKDQSLNGREGGLKLKGIYYFTS